MLELGLLWAGIVILGIKMGRAHKPVVECLDREPEELWISQSSYPVLTSVKTAALFTVL